MLVGLDVGEDDAQRPLPDGALVEVARGLKKDDEAEVGLPPVAPHACEAGPGTLLFTQPLLGDKEGLDMFPRLALLGVIAATFAATPSVAQLYGDPFGDLRPGYGRRAPAPQGPYDRGYDRGYDGRRGYDYDDGRRGRRGGGRFSDYCATSRGPCRTAPQPVGSNCRCDVDGLLKRGVIQ